MKTKEFFIFIVFPDPYTYNRFVNEEKILEVEVEPGMSHESQYPFISEGTDIVSHDNHMIYRFQVSHILTENQETLFL